jgi:exopolysaccharide biosynthesis WecB/TagA/CpsF family protein
MKDKLKVAFFMHNFAGGGVEKMRLTLAAALTNEHCNVSIVVVNSSGPLAMRLPENIELFDLKCSRLMWALPRLRGYLSVHRPDILVSSLGHNNVAALCARAMLRPRVKLVICQHNALSKEIRLGWKYWILPYLYRLLAGRADAIVAVSRGVADDLALTAGLRRSRIRVISNPVIESGAADVVTSAPHPWLEDQETPVFVFVGRLVPQKDPITLIVAFADHLARKNRSRLIIVGEGPLHDEMMKTAVRLGVAENIHFAGFVVDPLCWIAYADALILTSRYEGFANVIVEALACGTPVIATNCPFGPAEILDEGRYGRLIRVGDTAGFAEAMQEDLRAQFPAKLLRTRALNYTVQTATTNYLSLFSEMSCNRNSVFGLRFTSKTAKEVADHLIQAEPFETRLVVTPNIDHIRLMGVDSRFSEAYSTADIVCADGWPVAFYAGVRGAASYGRATGCDIIHHLVSSNLFSARRVFAVVESANTALALTRWLELRCLAGQWTIEISPPNLYQDLAAQRSIAEKVREAKPHLLVMTLGAPISEMFVRNNELPNCWALCVGQALRVEIGLAHRAPVAWRSLGMEWAWRWCHEPTRLGCRYLKSLIWFPYAVAMDLRQGGGAPQIKAVSGSKELSRSIGQSPRGD